MKKVLLTGVSGYVGQHCAVELLKSGYSVRGSVRSLSRKDEVINGIKKEVEDITHLEFCELDLLKEDGWDAAMEGCDFVLHVASPYVMKNPKNEDELIKPAVDGTLNALKAAKKAGVKRVVLTSSLVAMMGEVKGDITLTDKSWTDEKSKNISTYTKSKVMAEKAAWDFIHNQKGEGALELAVVNPGPIYGPTLTNNLSGESMKMFAQMISGKMPMLPQASTVMSDVRDVAKVHVLALEAKDAAGKRFITTTAEAYSFQHLAQILKSNGYDKVSTKLAPNFLLKFLGLFVNEVKNMLPFVGNVISADISLTQKTLNWEPIAIEKTVLDTAVSVKEALEG